MCIVMYRCVIQMAFFSSPVCIVNHITSSSRFTLWVGLLPSSIIAHSNFFMVCFALSTVPFPVCIRDGQY